MAVKKKSAPKQNPRDQVLAKLDKAGSKGEAEAKLRGKNNDPEILALLKALEHEGLVKKSGTGADTYWFIADAAPIPVGDYIKDKIASQEMTLLKETDILNKLPKYYSPAEAADAFKQLLAGSQIIKLQEGKSFRYLYLPDANSVANSSGYFISDTARFIYALVVLDGENQQRELGLSPVHYRDKKLARSWRDGIARKVHPDLCKHPQAQAASDALNRIYRRMTD